MQVTSFDLSKAMTFSKIFSKIKLSPSARLILRCLVDFYNPSKGLVYPGQNIISDCTGVSLRSITNAIEELRLVGLILTTKKVNHLNYHFTKKFFELVNIADNTRKNCDKQIAKTADTCHEQHEVKQIKNSKILNFQKNEPKPISQESTKKLLDQISQDKQNKKSPYDDKDCAIQWLNSLNDNDLKHSFILERVKKVKNIWKL